MKRYIILCLLVWSVAILQGSESPKQLHKQYEKQQQKDTKGSAQDFRDTSLKNSCSEFESKSKELLQKLDVLHNEIDTTFDTFEQKLLDLQKELRGIPNTTKNHQSNILKNQIILCGSIVVTIGCACLFLHSST